MVSSGASDWYGTDRGNAKYKQKNTENLQWGMKKKEIRNGRTNTKKERTEGTR
jgi:hypothetical protein